MTRTVWKVLFPLVFWGVAAEASPPPQRFVTAGSGVLRVSGPHCCGAQAFEGDFLLSYELDDAGNVRFHQLSTDLAPTMVPGVELFSVGDVEIACGHGRSRAEFSGAVSGDYLYVQVGALKLDATLYKSRSAEGQCENPQLSLEIINDSSVVFLHRPWANTFTLAASSFATTIDGDAYTVTLTLNGRFLNRPPAARVGLVQPGWEQGGCPAWLESGNPPRWLVEANDPSGLKVLLRSFSTDPDGAHSRTDVSGDLWLYATGGDPLEVLTVGPEPGFRTFTFGPEHHLALLSSDRNGALDEDHCRFEVVDTTAPAATLSMAPNSAPWGTWGTFVEVVASPAATDLVGPVTLELDSIVSNAPWWDHEDILGADYGTDDRIFKLRPYPAGSTTPREFTVTYRATDGAGNLDRATAIFTVWSP